MTRITSDVETLNELFSSGLVTVFGDLFTLLFIVVVMLRMDWKMALVTFAVPAFRLRSRLPVPGQDTGRCIGTSGCAWRGSTRICTST